MTDSLQGGIDRALGPAIRKGLRRRCPQCGEGKLFAGYLTVEEACQTCGEELHHHRADDLPPYLVIFIVGHVLVTGVMFTQSSTNLSTVAQMALWLPLTALVSLALLPPVKGAVVGLQWALRMHGFGDPEDDRT